MNQLSVIGAPSPVAGPARPVKTKEVRVVSDWLTVVGEPNWNLLYAWRDMLDEQEWEAAEQARLEEAKA